MSAKFRALTMEEMSEWPMYTTAANWSRITGYQLHEIHKAGHAGKFRADFVGNRMHISKKEFIRFFAPSLFSELYPDSHDPNLIQYQTAIKMMERGETEEKNGS